MVYNRTNKTQFKNRKTNKTLQITTDGAIYSSSTTVFWGGRGGIIIAVLNQMPGRLSLPYKPCGIVTDSKGTNVIQQRVPPGGGHPENMVLPDGMRSSAAGARLCHPGKEGVTI